MSNGIFWWTSAQQPWPQTFAKKNPEITDVCGNHTRESEHIRSTEWQSRKTACSRLLFQPCSPMQSGVGQPHSEYSGPLLPQDLHDWPEMFAERLPDELCNFDVEVILTSSYSGIGSAELGTNMVLKAYLAAHCRLPTPSRLRTALCALSC